MPSASSPHPSLSPLSPHAVRPSLVIVGAGPRGTGLIERLAANAGELYGGVGFDIHLVDPHAPGAGRIWRADQSSLLWMNSQAEDITMFTDETVRMEGPVREGPTLHEWAGLDGRVFSDRRTQGEYLRWVHESAVADLPEGVTVHHHPLRALRVSGPREGRQQVWLEGRPVRCSRTSSSSHSVIWTPNSTTNSGNWRSTPAPTDSSICRPTSPRTVTCLRWPPESRCSCGASGSPSSTSWCC